MKRSILTIVGIAIGHFAVSFLLAWLYLTSGPPKKTLGALSDDPTGYPLVVWLFPARNVANLFQVYPDHWFYTSAGWIVIPIASIVWAVVLYSSLAFIRGRRHAA
jgi:hypothetical protein